MRNATKLTVSTFGAIMGLAGIEHGIGEILQGNTSPDRLMILSWPESAFFRSVGGEPAMTIIPNLLVTGILAILFSTLFLAWVILFVQRKRGGLVLILLSTAMLLVGGGIFPPAIGIMIGALGTRINARFAWWRAHLSVGIRKFFGKIWPLPFVICLVAWLMLFPGINFIGYFFGINDPHLTIFLVASALGTLMLTVFAGFASDSLRQTDGYPAE